MGHRAEGEHYERQCRPGGVEAVGPVHDHPHAAVERFVTGVIDAQADGSQYARRCLRTVFASVTKGLSPLRDAREQKR